MPPPANVLADADVRLIVPVPVTVRPVAVAALQTVGDPAKVQVPAPMAAVRVFEFELLNVPALNVTLYPFASKVPVVKIKAAPEKEMLKASCS